MQALLFPIGQDWYALPLNVVREVIHAPVVTRIPAQADWLAGVANLRGELLPVVDTAARLGAAHADATHLAIVDTVKGTAGLCITGTPVPATLGDPTGAGEGLAAIARFNIGDLVATLLDVDELADVA